MNCHHPVTGNVLAVPGEQSPSSTPVQSGVLVDEAHREFEKKC
jgi:hypothetical protein